MKKFFGIFLSLILLQSALYAAGMKFHGSARNSIYAFESSEKHTRLYQFARFDLASEDGKVKLFSTMRALTDASQSMSGDDRFKVYSLGLKYQNLFNRLDLTVGRQFFHPGTILGGLDGINARLMISGNLSLQLYGGVESQFQRAFKIYRTSDSRVTGGVLQLSKLLSSQVQLLYLRKENDGGVFWNIAGANFLTNLLPRTTVRVQAHYDMENERMHRLLASARNNWTSRFSTTLEYKSQHPQVYANSFFTIFELKAYNQYRAAATFQIVPGYYVSGQYQLVQFEEDNANRLFMFLQNNNGSLGFVYESGYAGDQLGVMFDYAIPVSEKLTASVYTDYSKYRTEEVYEYENQLANAARLSYRLNRGLSIDVEYQWLTNRFKSQDSRFLNHISFVW